MSEELMPELAHRQPEQSKPKLPLPTCMHSTEYRVQIQEDNSVDSGASVRVVSLLLNKRSQFSTVPSSPFSSACAGSVVPRVPVRYVRQRIPLFFLFVFFFCRSDDNNTSLEYRVSDSQSCVRASPLGRPVRQFRPIASNPSTSTLFCTSYGLLLYAVCILCCTPTSYQPSMLGYP